MMTLKILSNVHVKIDIMMMVNKLHAKNALHTVITVFKMKINALHAEVQILELSLITQISVNVKEVIMILHSLNV